MKKSWLFSASTFFLMLFLHCTSLAEYIYSAFTSHSFLNDKLIAPIHVPDTGHLFVAMSGELQLLIVSQAQPICVMINFVSGFLLLRCMDCKQQVPHDKVVQFGKQHKCNCCHSSYRWCCKNAPGWSEMSADTWVLFRQFSLSLS